MIRLLLVLLLSCTSQTKQNFENLDLTNEKEYIKDSLDIPETKKKYILETFNRTEKYCNACVAEIENLKVQNLSLLEEIKILDSQAKIYRYFRNAILGLIALSILFYFKDSIFSLIKLGLRI